ncbi:hypothetical protein BASA81_010812 [Batrachochytrium salamandrivorans]|nr:hypothetical protein BASA81_010812 [Batrachochytrium salamandrivorans]
MATLFAQIYDPAHVAEAVAAMGNPDCKYKEIYLYDSSPPPSPLVLPRFNPLPLTIPLNTASELACDWANAGTQTRNYAEQEVGEKGNQAVRDHIARALENCRVKNVHITFRYCNLDRASVQLLANAVEKNTCIGGFACEQNPFNFPDGENYDPSTDEPVKRAIIASKAPITMWNWKELPQDMVEARRQRVAAATVAVPPPPASSLDALPTLQDFALAQEEHAKEEQVLTECQAKLEADTKELEETRALLVQLQARSATLERGIAQTAARVQAAKANIAKHVHVLDTVEAIRKHMGSLVVTKDANLCGVCFEREKNRTFYKCGHQCCSSCADAIMRVKKECPYCREGILDVIPVFN